MKKSLKNYRYWYWILYSHTCRFRDGYVIGIATNQASAKQYYTKGFTRIPRSIALSRLLPPYEYLFRSVTINGEAHKDCFEVARALRAGEI